MPRRKGRSLLKIIRLFVVGIVGFSLLEWAEARISNKAIEVNKSSYENENTTNNNKERGQTNLHIAIKAKNLKLIKNLVDKGADINGTNIIKATPLHYAASFGDEQIVSFLIEKGADVNALDNENKTPIDWAKNAKRNGNIRLLKSLSD